MVATKIFVLRPDGEQAEVASYSLPAQEALYAYYQQAIRKNPCTWDYQELMGKDNPVRKTKLGNWMFEIDGTVYWAKSMTAPDVVGFENKGRYFCYDDIVAAKMLNHPDTNFIFAPHGETLNPPICCAKCGEVLTAAQ